MKARSCAGTAASGGRCPAQADPPGEPDGVEVGGGWQPRVRSSRSGVRNVLAVDGRPQAESPATRTMPAAGLRRSARRDRPRAVARGSGRVDRTRPRGESRRHPGRAPDGCRGPAERRARRVHPQWTARSRGCARPSDGGARAGRHGRGARGRSWQAAARLARAPAVGCSPSRCPFRHRTRRGRRDRRVVARRRTHAAQGARAAGRRPSPPSTRTKPMRSREGETADDSAFDRSRARGRSGARSGEQAPRTQDLARRAESHAKSTLIQRLRGGNDVKHPQPNPGDS